MWSGSETMTWCCLDLELRRPEIWFPINSIGWGQLRHYCIHMDMGWLFTCPVFFLCISQGFTNNIVHVLCLRVTFLGKNSSLELNFCSEMIFDLGHGQTLSPCIDWKQQRPIHLLSRSAIHCETRTWSTHCAEPRYEEWGCRDDQKSAWLSQSRWRRAGLWGVSGNGRYGGQLGAVFLLGQST